MSIFVGGVDEAGRGPLAGPVVAAAVVLSPVNRIAGLNDSKKLTEKQREKLFDQITSTALAFSVQMVGPREIEQLNIRTATRVAMERAAASVEQELLERVYWLIDGNMQLAASYLSEAIVKGDQRLRCISAASILAKVTRDREMCRLDQLYPQYQLALHKGYPTPVHRNLIRELGPTEIHRRSFAGVKEYL